MIWIALSEKDTGNAVLEKRIRDAADQFRANSGLKSQEYSAPVLDLVFLGILDPACGSDGKFVSSAHFVSEHKKNPAAELSIHGVEKTDETGRLCRLNLAVHGLEDEIKHGGNINSYDDDPHDATGRFDFANCCMSSNQSGEGDIRATLQNDFSQPSYATIAA